jgi:hypothetical protein
MSHFTVLVIGPDVEKQLQPFHEYECTGHEDEFVVFVPAENTLEEYQKEYVEQDKTDYPTFEDYMKDYHGYNQENGVWGRRTNPNAKWDWWEVGGRWTGYFKPKPGKGGELGRPGVFDNKPDEGHVDSILKGDLDIEAMRDDAGTEAGELWDFVENHLGHLPKAESWESIRNRIPDIDEARDFNNNQPRTLMVSSNKFLQDKLGWFPNMDKFNVSRDEYVSKARNGAISSFAVVKDYTWIEKGDMGWFGIVTDEMDQNEWDVKFNQMIDELPDDTLLTIVDCHI